MSELVTRTNWRQSITGHKSNSGGRTGRKQAEKPTLTEQGIDVDEFIRENHASIQRLRETTPRNRKPEPTYRKVYETWLEQSKTGHPSERSIAKALGKSVSTIHHHVTNLVRDGYLAKDTIREREYVLTGKPFNPSDMEKAKQSPDTLARIREETVRLQNITVTEAVPEKQCENPRAIIANALVGIYDSISALQRAAYQANDKVVYGFATKLMNGELMDIKANYSKDVAK